MSIFRKIYGLFPAAFRLSVRVWLRNNKDRKQGVDKQFVTRTSKQLSLPIQRSLSLRIAPTETLKAKLHNLSKSIAFLEGLEIQTGQIFSFWHLVGKAGQSQGYLPSRNIVGGALVSDFGGGLCQISTIIYELSLRCGLQVLERHAHSTNVYTPQTAYTTLGLDATVTYGYKDLRVCNPFPFSCHFSFELTDNQLTAHLCANHLLPVVPLLVKHDNLTNGLQANVYKQEHEKWLPVSSDFYLAWNQ